MGRRNDHTREELRDLALRTAANIVESAGPGALTMREVARRIGYTVGALYHSFANLDDLIVQMNERTVIELRQALENVNRQSNDAGQRLRLLAAAYLGFALLHTHRWRLVFEHRLPVGQAAPKSYRSHTAALFEMVQQNLPTSSCGRQRVDAPVVAAALWSSVHGICMLAVSGKLQVGTTASVQKLLDVLLDRFLEPPASKSKRG